MTGDPHKYVVARAIAKRRAADAPNDRSGLPPMPHIYETPAPKLSPLGKFSRHLDGADEHRCQTCFIAYADGLPLCDAGQALYEASH